MIIVDRIIDGLAICEKDGASINIPLSQITGNVREGDMLRENESGVRYSVDSEETRNRRTALSERFERIKAKQNKK